MRLLVASVVLIGGCSGTAEEFVDPDTDITWENSAPVAADDSADGRSGMIQTIDVLSNDSDPDNEVLTITGVEGSSGATVEVAADGWSVTYTPGDDFTGTDTFTYTIADPWGLTDEGEVTVNIQPSLALVITYPSEGEVVSGAWPVDTGGDLVAAVNIEYTISGCTGTSPSQDPDDCHLHRWIDDVKYSPFGWYAESPINDMVFGPGEHTVKLQVIRNDGSDAAFLPVIEDEVTFTVE